MRLVHLLLLFFVLPGSRCVEKRKTTISASSGMGKQQTPVISATPKLDYRDSGDYLTGHTSSGKDFPPKVIRVTKTIAVQVPVPVPVKMSDHHPTHESYRAVTPPILPTKRYHKSPKFGSSDSHFENSIWHQNFPPFTSAPGKRKRSRPTETPPTAGYINISQDPDTKSVNINIPWNAAMKPGFMDEISRNPHPLLNSLNLLPSADHSSYGAPASGSSFDATVFTSQKEFQDFSNFYNVPNMDEPFMDPSSSSYAEHSQYDEHNNVTSYYRYPIGTGKKSTKFENEVVQYREPRLRKPGKALDSEAFQSHSHTFLGAFSPDDSAHSPSDSAAKLRASSVAATGSPGSSTREKSPKRPGSTRSPRAQTKKNKKYQITLIKKGP